jgi:hypothetical protein
MPEVKTMTRLMVVPLFALGACATVSGAPAGSPGQRSTAGSVAWEPMFSPPPEPRKEDVPKLQAKEVWVPGYYLPLAGTWLWHQGEVRDAKQGYTLVPASTKEDNGKFMFTPPRWRRSDLAAPSSQ